MSIPRVIELLTAFERYVEYMNQHGQDDVIQELESYYEGLLITMRGHNGETYELEVYFSGVNEGELCIDEPATNVSVFDVIDYEEYELTEEIVHYLKYGK